MDANVLSNIDNIKNAINKKMFDIKREHSEEAHVSRRLLAPVADPLEKILDLSKTRIREVRGKKSRSEDEASDEISLPYSENEEESIEDWENAEETFESSPYNYKHYIEYNLKDDENGDVDKVYGPRLMNGMLKMGNYVVEVDEDTIHVGGKSFPITEGLIDLLLYKEPDNYSKEDMNNYKKILETTNRHLNRSGNLKTSNSRKYNSIISKMFNKKGGGGGGGGGGGKKLGGDYVYFDDFNELVNRLRLLVGSQNAGNTSHNNEMISIIEELREKNIIY